MIEWLEKKADIDRIRTSEKDFHILFFWGGFSDAAQRARKEIGKLAEEYEKVAIHGVDVEQIKGLHKEYDVKSVPTVVAVKNGKVVRRIEGVESDRFYATQLLGAAPTNVAIPKQKKALKVTVYTSPGCPACNRLKDYLRKRKVPFRSVDVSRDRAAAGELAKRSGQKAVPQTDINGRLIVGFDQKQIDAMLRI